MLYKCLRNVGWGVIISLLEMRWPDVSSRKESLGVYLSDKNLQFLSACDGRKDMMKHLSAAVAATTLGIGVLLASVGAPAANAATPMRNLVLTGESVNTDSAYKGYGICSESIGKDVANTKCVDSEATSFNVKGLVNVKFDK
jgi:hypothetical protein